jgi:hypothetical protein
VRQGRECGQRTGTAPRVCIRRGRRQPPAKQPSAPVEAAALPVASKTRREGAARRTQLTPPLHPSASGTRGSDPPPSLCLRRTSLPLLPAAPWSRVRQAWQRRALVRRIDGTYHSVLLPIGFAGSPSSPVAACVLLRRHNSIVPNCYLLSPCRSHVLCPCSAR